MADRRFIPARDSGQRKTFRQIPPQGSIEVKEDSAMETLATTLLAGTSAYLGLRHFPKGEIVKMQNSLGKFLGVFKKDVADIVGTNLSSVYRKSSFNNGPVSWLQSKGMAPPPVHEAEWLSEATSLIDTIHNLKRTGSSAKHQVDSILKSLSGGAQKHLTRNEKVQLRQVTLGEFMDAPSQFRHAISSQEQGRITNAYSQLKSAIREKTGTNVNDKLLRNTVMDRGIFKANQGTKIYDTRAFSGRGLSIFAQRMTQFKLPLLGFSPIDLLKPKMWWSPRYAELDTRIVGAQLETSGALGKHLKPFGYEKGISALDGAWDTQHRGEVSSLQSRLNRVYQEASGQTPRTGLGQSFIDDALGNQGIIDRAYFSRGKIYADIKGAPRVVPGGFGTPTIGYGKSKTIAVAENQFLAPTRGAFGFEMGQKLGLNVPGQMSRQYGKSNVSYKTTAAQDAAFVDYTSTLRKNVKDVELDRDNYVRSLIEKGKNFDKASVDNRADFISQLGKSAYNESSQITSAKTTLDRVLKAPRGVMEVDRRETLTSRVGNFFSNIIDGVGLQHRRSKGLETFEVGLFPAAESLRNVYAGHPNLSQDFIKSGMKLGKKQKLLGKMGINPTVTVDGLSTRVTTRSGGDRYIINAGGEVEKKNINVFDFGVQNVSEPTKLGIRGDYYSYSALQGIDNAGVNLLNRTHRIVENMFGVGIAPGKNTGETFAKTFTKLILPAYGVVQGASYADYKTEQVTGFSPINAAVSMYETGRLAVQGTLDYTGIQDTAQYIEDLMPGLVNSPLSQGVRAAGSMYLGAKSRSKAGMAMGMFGAAISLTDITQTADSLKRVYEGDELVPVRKSRYWVLGRDPFGGSDIDYYRPNWTKLVKNDYKKKSIYGGEKEYWSHGCVEANTNVIMSDGSSKEIQFIEEGDEVLTKDGEVGTVTQKTVKPSKMVPGNGVGIEIKTSLSYKSVKFTPDHEIWAVKTDVCSRHNSIQCRPQRSMKECAPCKHKYYKKYNTDWVQSSNIRKNDYVSVPRIKKRMPGEIPVPDYGFRLLKNSLKLPSVLVPSKALYRVYGYFLAEGNVEFQSSNGKPCGIRLTQYPGVVRDKMKSSLEEAFPGVSITDSGKTLQVSSGTLASLFLDIFGHGAKNKHVPEEILWSEDEFFYEFLGAYIDGDGHRKNGSTTITTASQDIATQIQTRLLGDGVFTAIGFSKRYERDNDYPITETYRIIIYEDKNISYYGWFDESSVYVRVREVSECDLEEFVYDIAVDKDPSFITSIGAIHNSWLPTPENWFGLKHFTDPYYLEEKNYKERPYLLTGKFGNDIPLVGPVISETIGKVVKPVNRMHEQYWQGDSIKASPQWIGPRGFDEASLEAVGYRSVGLRQQAYDPNQFGSFLARQADKMDYFGFYNFMGGFVKDIVTGSNDFSSRRKSIASADQIDSVSRDYYDKSLGGMLGYSELYRRFVVNDHQARRNIVNPSRNLMPTWLPGKESNFKKDRDFYLDYQSGDPYAKVKQGEARLPGTGYEELHRLHSGVPGIYDPMDRYKILADVAPYSQAFYHYEAIVKGWAASGALDDYWTKKFYDTKRQAENVRNSEFSPSRFSEVFSPVTNDWGKKHRSALASENEYLKEREYTLPEKMVGHMWEKFKGHQAEIGAAAGMYFGGGGGMLYGTILGGMSENKWLPGNDAITDYEKFQFYSRKFSDWNSPVDSFISPYVRKMQHAVFDDYVPDHVIQRRQIEQYYDEVKFVKNRRLKMMATNLGESQLASRFTQEMKSTMLYQAQASSAADMQSHVYKAMPKTERPYFQQFSGESDPRRRERILDIVPDYMGSIYLKMWQNQDMDREDSKIKFKEDTEISTSGFVMPRNDWSGWHPGVDLQYAKVKTMHNQGLDIHDAGLWEQQLDVADSIPDMYDPFHEDNKRRANIHEDIYRKLRKMGYENIQIHHSNSYGGPNNVRMNVRQDKNNNGRQIGGQHRRMQSGSF